MVNRLLKDESGQTMLEQTVIVVFVVIAAIVGFRLVKGTVSRNIKRVAYSIEGKPGHTIRKQVEPYYFEQ
jgi:Flp pilus assembly pilin Flp